MPFKVFGSINIRPQRKLKAGYRERNSHTNRLKVGVGGWSQRFEFENKRRNEILYALKERERDIKKGAYNTLKRGWLVERMWLAERTWLAEGMWLAKEYASLKGYGSLKEYG